MSASKICSHNLIVTSHHFAPPKEGELPLLKPRSPEKKKSSSHVWLAWTFIKKEHFAITKLAKKTIDVAKDAFMVKNLGIFGGGELKKIIAVQYLFSGNFTLYPNLLVHSFGQGKMVFDSVNQLIVLSSPILSRISKVPFDINTLSRIVGGGCCIYGAGKTLSKSWVNRDNLGYMDAFECALAVAGVALFAFSFTPHYQGVKTTLTIFSAIADFSLGSCSLYQKVGPFITQPKVA